METAFAKLDAAEFLEIWNRFASDENGHIEGKKLDLFFRHMMEKLAPQDQITEEKVQQLKQQCMAAYDYSADGRLQMNELANMILPKDENFLLIFRREAPLDNSVDFMKIWRNYDMNSNGYIEAMELKSFLKDLFAQHKKDVPSSKLDEYTNAMIKAFDKNSDGHLDLNDLARILAIGPKENFLLQFNMDSRSPDERKRDFEKIFSHYDVDNTGALEESELDTFVKDVMELVRPGISEPDLEMARKILLRDRDENKDGKIQKDELAEYLGVKSKP